MSKSKRKLKRSSQTQPQAELSAGVSANADVVDAGSAQSPSGQSSGTPAGMKNLLYPGAGKKGESGKPLVDPVVDPEQPHKFKRSLWRHLIRYPAAGMLALLNVAIFMSFVERLPRYQHMDPFRELFFFGTVAFIDIFLFVPIVFEVNRIETDKDGLSLSTLLWRTRLKWEHITHFEQPKYLKFAIVRTPRCFYLLNKYHLKPFYELAAIISAKMPKRIQDTEA